MWAPFVLESFQALGDEGDLDHRLASGEGHSPIGGRIELYILQKLADVLVNVHLPGDRLKDHLGVSLDERVRLGQPAAVKAPLSSFSDQRSLVLPHGHIRVRDPFGEEVDLLIVEGDQLGVGAPFAGEVAALHEDCGS